MPPRNLKHDPGLPVTSNDISSDRKVGDVDVSTVMGASGWSEQGWTLYSLTTFTKVLTAMVREPHHEWRMPELAQRARSNPTAARAVCEDLVAVGHAATRADGRRANGTARVRLYWLTDAGREAWNDVDLQPL